MFRGLHVGLSVGALVVTCALSLPSAFAESKRPPAKVEAQPGRHAPDSADSSTRRRAGPDANSPASAAAAASTQRRRELDQMRREDVAAQLALLGVLLKWQDHSLTELVDWRDRIEAAVTLRVQYRVDVDWRKTSLRDLIEMRMRAAKASELASAYGVHVDWHRYSWVALEGLRRRMAKLSPAASAAAFEDDGLVRPGSAGAARRPGRHLQDPDAIIEPTFAVDTPVAWSRPFGAGGRADPDAILVPTFLPVAPPPAGPDDVIDPWAPRRRR